MNLLIRAQGVSAGGTSRHQQGAEEAEGWSTRLKRSRSSVHDQSAQWNQYRHSSRSVMSPTSRSE